MRKTTARMRMDGEKTRETLIEAAGTLAAQKGWANVAAKEVCELAGVNSASINYWFGGRDQLYEAVLSRIPQAIFSKEMEIEMVQYETPEAALNCFFSHHLKNLDAAGNWPIKLWAREVTSCPSESFQQLVKNTGKERVGILMQFFADYLGVADRQDIRVQVAFVSSMSPLFLLMIASPELKHVVIPSLKDQDKAFKALLKNQIFTGLRLMRTQIASEARSAR